MSTLLQNFSDALKHWYIPLIIGLIFLIGGIYIFTVPVETYIILSIFFSVSFISSGLLEIFFALSNSNTLRGWGWYLAGGIVTFLMGIYLVTNPGISITLLPLVVGFTIMFRSIQGLAFAFDLKNAKVSNWGLLAFISVLGILISFLLLDSPLITGISIAIFTGMAFVFSGIAYILFSLQLKKIKDMPDKMNADVKNKIEALQKEINHLMNNH